MTVTVSDQKYTIPKWGSTGYVVCGVRSAQSAVKPGYGCALLTYNLSPLYFKWVYIDQ